MFLQEEGKISKLTIANVDNPREERRNENVNRDPKKEREINKKTLKQRVTVTIKSWTVVVTQLVERLLPTPEAYGSNPGIGNFFTTNCSEKTKVKKK